MGYIPWDHKKSNMTKRLTKHNTAITQNTYQQPLSLLECVCVYLSEREKKRLEKRGKGDLVRREKISISTDVPDLNPDLRSF